MPVEHATAKIFSSGERDSAVEHILHMDRLVHAKFKEDVAPGGGVDFYQPIEKVVDPRLSYFLATKQQRRTFEEEQKILQENNYLMEKLFAADNFEQRRKRNISLLPEERDQNVLLLASNLKGRVREAKRIQSVNGVLLAAMVGVKPSVSTSAILESHRKHLAAVQRISKFRPAETFAGQNLLRREFGVECKGDGADEGAVTTPVRRQPWSSVSPADVRERVRQKDMLLRWPGGLKQHDNAQSARGQSKQQEQQQHEQQQLSNSARSAPRPPTQPLQASASPSHRRLPASEPYLVKLPRTNRTEPARLPSPPKTANSHGSGGGRIKSSSNTNGSQQRDRNSEGSRSPSNSSAHFVVEDRDIYVMQSGPCGQSSA